MSETEAVTAYAKLHLGFAHVHPFWDGKGRMARLLCNIPVLRSGHLLVVIDVQDCREYIDILARYELEAGQLSLDTGVWPTGAEDAPFRTFCQRAYQATRNLIDQARDQQAKRNRKRNGGAMK